MELYGDFLKSLFKKIDFIIEWMILSCFLKFGNCVRDKIFCNSSTLEGHNSSVFSVIWDGRRSTEFCIPGSLHPGPIFLFQFHRSGSLLNMIEKYIIRGVKCRPELENASLKAVCMAFLWHQNSTKANTSLLVRCLTLWYNHSHLGSQITTDWVPRGLLSVYDAL